MATNTLNGVNLDKLAELTLNYLGTEGVPLDLFTTDLGSGIKEKGETVTTRFPNGVTSQDMSANRGSQNASTVKRTVTLDQYRGVVLGFNDLERSYTNTNLEELFIIPAISTLVDEMIEHTLSLVTTANGFDTHQTVSAAAAFDSDAVAGIAQKLSENKVPKAKRNLIIPPSYLTSLVTDGAIKDASSYAGSDPIRENLVPRLFGLNVIEYNGTIPSNSENVTALACTPQSLVVVAREIAEPDPQTYAGQVRTIIDENSGLPIQIRKFYSEEDGEQKISFTILYGAEIGVVENASRIVSSA